MQEKLRKGVGFLKVDQLWRNKQIRSSQKKKGPGANGPQRKLERETLNKTRSQREREGGV